MSESVFSIVTRLRARLPAIRIPAGIRDLSLLHNVQTALGSTRPAIQSVPEGEDDYSPHSSAEANTNRAIPPLLVTCIGNTLNRLHLVILVFHYAPVSLVYAYTEPKFIHLKVIMVRQLLYVTLPLLTLLEICTCIGKFSFKSGWIHYCFMRYVCKIQIH
jgi:hypothetical protein